MLDFSGIWIDVECWQQIVSHLVTVLVIESLKAHFLKGCHDALNALRNVNGPVEEP